MISVEVRNLPEVLEWLGSIKAIVGAEGWNARLGMIGDDLVEYAQSISPVKTGAYQASHRATVSNSMLTVSIDPAARNPVTGGAVTRYAGAVEARHNVYGRLGAYLDVLSDSILQDVVRELDQL